MGENPTKVEVAGHWAVYKPGDGWYVFTRGPMGHKAMVFIGHTTTQFLVWLVGKKFPNVVYDVIIDDVAMAGDNEEEVSQAQQMLLQLAAQVGIVASKVEPTSRRLEHRGLVFEWQAESCLVSLKPAFTKKVEARVAYLAKQKEVTQQQLESIAGMMAWTIVALGTLDVEHEFTAFATYRVLATLSAAGAASKQKLSLTLHRELDQWVAAVHQTGHVRTVRRGDRPWLVVTDACATPTFAAWGGVVVSPAGEITVVKGIFSENERAHMTVLEMAAIGKTLVASEKLHAMRHDDAVVACDNMPVVATLARRRSRSFPLHCELKRTLQLLKSVPFRVIWVPTATNPSDGISRGKDWCADDAKKLHALLSSSGVRGAG